MTEKFIKRHCENCEFLIRHYSGFGGGPIIPDMCGEIDDGGGRSFGELETMTIEQCRKGYKK